MVHGVGHDHETETFFGFDWGFGSCLDLGWAKGGKREKEFCQKGRLRWNRYSAT